MVNFEAINSAALGQFESLVREWLPAGVRRGHEYVVGDLGGQKPGESCSINLNKGLWADFQTGDKGGDPISLFAAIQQISQVEAAKKLAEKFGIPVDDPTPSRKKINGNSKATTKPANGNGSHVAHPPVTTEPNIIWPVPDSAPPPLNKHARLGTPDSVYTYTDINGLTIGYVCRFNQPDGKKEIVPQVFTEKGWRWKSFPTPRPLYNLQDLDIRQVAPVMIVEGEGCADLAKQIFKSYVVVTWPGGGKAAHLADWRYIYGRKVVIWPDRDRHKYQPPHAQAGEELPYEEQAGTLTAEAIAKEIAPHCPSVQIIDVRNLPNNGDDVKDRVAAGWTREDIVSWARANIRTWGALPSQVTTQSTGAVIDKNDPYGIASTLEKDEFKSPHGPVRHHGGLWYKWTGTHYPVSEDAFIRTKIWAWLANSFIADKDGGTVPMKPKSQQVSNVVDALEAKCYLSSDVMAPTFLDGRMLTAKECISMRNGIVELRTGALHEHSSNFWSHNCVPYDYTPNAPPPTTFLKVLNDQWAHDPQSIDTLQEIFGYCLTTDTSLQKMFMIVGPPRAGKGVISDALAGMIGHDNVVTPNFDQIQRDFGLAPLIGKMVALVSDARLEGSQTALVERLLNISGEDSMTVNRKNMSHWNGKLSARFFICTNMLPRFGDASGAIASRFIVLSMKKSHMGKEDIGIRVKIKAELPAIFNWAREGLLRLKKRGHFIMPTSSKDKIEEFMELAAPINAFIRDTCIIEPSAKTDVRVMFSLWTKWCKDNGRDGHGTFQTFSRDLKSQQPDITTERAAAWGGGSAQFVGIKPVPGALDVLNRTNSGWQENY